MNCVRKQLFTSKRILSSALVIASTISEVANICEGFYIPSSQQITHKSFTLGPKRNDLPSPLFFKRDRHNPFEELLSGRASALISSPSVISPYPSYDERITHAIPYSWDNIQSELSKVQTTKEKSFRSNIELGIGPPSPLHDIRLYHKSDDKSSIRVTFYRDTKSLCPFCQKVWMTLEQKKIPYKVHKIKHESCFCKDSVEIPIAKIDGVVYSKSDDVIYALESMYHKNCLSPKKKEMERANDFIRMERKIVDAWMNWLTGSRYPERHRNEFTALLDELESELKKSNSRFSSKGFFLGNRVTMVDIMFAPYLERMAASLLFFKGFQMRVPPGMRTPYPYLNKWFDAMETLESYQFTKSDYYTHNIELLQQLKCKREPDGKPYEKAIIGERLLNHPGKSWELPLQMHNGGIEPDWRWCGDDKVAKREAVERLVHNHKNAVRFAADGAKKVNFPSHHRLLTHANGVPAEAVIASIDAVMRCVAIGMLKGVESVEEEMEEVANIVNERGDDFKKSIVKSVTHFRDRIIVPKDMCYPAARNLRAHLNWALEKILE